MSSSEGPVVIVEYDSRWPLMFQEEKRRILDAADERIVAAEHVGSTSVVGLGAKPIIDILGGVKRLKDAEACILPFESIGYAYEKEKERIFPERRFFSRPSYHLHVVEIASDFWRRHLVFRDYLRKHPKTAREYFELKKKLAAKYGTDRDGYTDAKTRFITAVTTKAGFRPKG